MEKVKVWPIEKYARFVSGGAASSASAAVDAASSSTAKKTEGAWQHYSSRDGGIQLALVESNHFMVSSGTMIFESFSLWEAQKWLKIVTKGDSAMFIYRLKDENRRFRVKFSAMNPSTSALETCRQFAIVLAPLVSIRDMSANGASTVARVDTGSCKAASTHAMESDSQLVSYDDSQVLDSQLTSVPCERPPRNQGETEHHQPSGMVVSDGSRETVQPDESKLIPIPDIGKLLQTQGNPLGLAYAHTNFPTEQLGGFIRLCLTDANFPGFVEAVEKELNSMTGNSLSL